MTRRKRDESEEDEGTQSAAAFRTQGDAEVQAMSKCIPILDELGDEDAQQRVINYLADRYGVELGA